VLLVYGGLFAFLLTNLRSWRVALWTWIVILAFEVGFQPLLLFRFVAFVPFMVAYFNSLDTDAASAAVTSKDA
jgi:hypothetical protein